MRRPSTIGNDVSSTRAFLHALAVVFIFSTLLTGDIAQYEQALKRGISLICKFRPVFFFNTTVPIAGWLLRFLDSLSVILLRAWSSPCGKVAHKGCGHS